MSTETGAFPVPLLMVAKGKVLPVVEETLSWAGGIQILGKQQAAFA